MLLHRNQRSNVRNGKEICGNFVAAADGSVSSQNGQGFTVAKVTGNGKYTITLDRKWVLKTVGFGFVGTNVDTTITALSYSSGVLTIQVADGGSAANVAGTITFEITVA